MANLNFPPGKIINEEYKVIDEAGRGGFGHRIEGRGAVGGRCNLLAAQVRFEAMARTWTDSRRDL